MIQYKVFKHPSGLTEAVKQGWSWPGFFFGSFWAMAKKMWGLGIGVLIGFLVFGMIVGVMGGGTGGEGLINFIALVANIIFGVKGNSWRKKYLVSRGVDQVDTVTAANPEGAVALYMKGMTTDPVIHKDAAL